MNTVEFLAIASAIVPNRPVIIFDDKIVTFQDLEERTNRLANAMAAEGVGPGDRVGIMAVNSDNSLEIYFAAAKLDAIFVPYSFRAKVDELAFLMVNVAPKVFFADNRYVNLVQSLHGKVPALDQTTLVNLDGPAELGWCQKSAFMEGFSAEAVHSPSALDEATTVLMYTSGTTGTPKGAMLTHNSFASYILANVPPVDPDVEERNLLSVPFFHIAGLQAGLAAVYSGRTLIVQRQFEPVEWMQLVEKHKVNRVMMVPTMLKQLMNHAAFSIERLSSLKVITYGAAPMPNEVLLEALEKFPNVDFINAFGQTESGGTLTMLYPEDHRIPPGLSLDERAVRIKRLGSIGRPLPDIELGIVDEYGNNVGTGQVGEIVAKGLRIMKGYSGHDKDKENTIKNGWLFTGDLGFQDEAGYVFIAGRAKDFIKRGGEMVSPLEVEDVLCSHPSIDDAAVIGIKDLLWGERVRAILVLKSGTAKPSLKEITGYCSERLASFKRPEDIVYVDELPRNPMGKVLKSELRQKYSQPISP